MHRQPILVHLVIRVATLGKKEKRAVAQASQTLTTVDEENLSTSNPGLETSYKYANLSLQVDLAEYERCIETLQSQDPHVAFYKQKGNPYRSTYGVLKSMKAQPQISFDKKLFPLDAKEWVLQQIIARHNLRQLECEQGDQSKEVLSQLRLIHTQSSKYGVYHGFLRLEEGFKTRLKIGDSVTIYFTPDIGRSWQGRVVARTSKHASATDVCLMVTAYVETETTTDEEGNVNTSKHIHSAKPEHIFDATALKGTDIPKLVQFLHDGPANWAKLHVRYSNQSIKRQFAAFRELNPFDVDATDPEKHTARAWQDERMGFNMRKQCQPKNRY